MNIQRAYVEITNLCNLHCDFCAGHHRPLMAMRTDDFAVAAKKLRAVTQYIYLHVMGEPLLHPELGKILDTCAQLDFRVCITTNGTLLPKKLDILLACPALHKVAVSLHSFEGNHLNVPLEDYVTGCLRSCQKLAAAGVNCTLRLWNSGMPQALNPEIERITARKPKLYALNKADLADPAVTEEWIKYFRAADAGCVAISAKQKGGANAVKAAIEKELAGLLERRQNRGMGGAKTQVMLCGIPNVGKSTFINTFAGSARAKAADRPGVTKGKQWVSTDKFDLLDMPGVLWKKFDSKTIASNLAFIGSIKDDILDVEELAMNLLDEVRRNYPDLVAQRYKLDAETLALPPYELMEAIGRKRGLLVRGGEVNTERCAIMLVDEFRACKWGRISLERPPQRDDLADFAEEDDE